MPADFERHHTGLDDPRLYLMNAGRSDTVAPLQGWPRTGPLSGSGR